jgi:hypothetical protein
MAICNLNNYTDKDGLGFPLNFRRGNPNPLDNSSVWASYDEAKTYAKTDPTAYVGQILTVVAEDGTTIAYIIDKDGNLNDLATELYVDNKVAGLVDSAPNTLNTLNELAKALGNDANFATTVSNEIGKKVPNTRTINNKALTGDISLDASDVGAVPTSRTINNKALSANVSLTASDVNAVPTTRTVNGKPLSTNISLSASDVGALPNTTKLADLGDDSTHRVVTDAEKTAWNAKSDFNGSYTSLKDTPSVAVGEENGAVAVHSNKNVAFMASTSSGVQTVAGFRGLKLKLDHYYDEYGNFKDISGDYVCVDDEKKIYNGTYYLESVQDIEVNDKYSISLRKVFKLRGTVTSVNKDNDTITVTNYVIPSAIPDNEGYIDQFSFIWIPSRLGDIPTPQAYGCTSDGNFTKAIGLCSHAMGTMTRAGGKNSYAGGMHTIADQNEMMAIGRYNKVEDGLLLAVGNGSKDTNTKEITRSNALAVYGDGHITTGGRLTVGAEPTNNMDAATKQYVDNAIKGIGDTGVTVDLSNYYTKSEIDSQIGDIETALDTIIEIQNSLIGGDA